MRVCITRVRKIKITLLKQEGGNNLVIKLFFSSKITFLF